MKYTVSVISGHSRGKRLGFPTFNLKIPLRFVAEQGIYAAWVWVKGKKYSGALHYGPVPVFADPTPRLEVFVLDYFSSIPVSRLTFQLVKRLRPIKDFASPESLKTQIASDVKATRKLLAS